MRLHTGLIEEQYVDFMLKEYFLIYFSSILLSYLCAVIEAGESPKHFLKLLIYVSEFWTCFLFYSKVDLKYRVEM
jgi:hypothetical protein